MRPLLALGVLLALGACADIAMTPAALTADPAQTTLLLDRPVSGAPMVQAPSGTSSFAVRTLKPGSAWIVAGSIAQGTVLRPRDTVLTAEATHVHEAYMVVQNDSWVGFWLPYEKAFSPLKTPVPVRLRQP